MTKRLAVFHGYATHPWLRKAFRRLNPSEVRFCESFITLNDHRTKGDFEMITNRLFLDNPSRPKNWTIISELLTNANSALKDP